jgi:gamma-glutamylcyclotransferase (GGCT)/AIG2-like uncharacterized protein YtfP
VSHDVPGPGAVVGVYGTLRRHEVNAGLMAEGSTYLGDGWVAGRLFMASPADPWPYPYPGFVAGGTGRVKVELYEVLSAELWRALDALERYDPADPGSPYVRRLTVVDGGAVPEAWVYHHVGAPAEPVRWITTGDWRGRE